MSGPKVPDTKAVERKRREFIKKLSRRPPEWLWRSACNEDPGGYRADNLEALVLLGYDVPQQLPRKGDPMPRRKPRLRIIEGGRS